MEPKIEIMTPPRQTFWRRRASVLLLIFVLALIVRALTAYFIGMRLDVAGWFPYGIYNVFDAQARAILDGLAPAFWISDPSQTSAAIYPPGYSLWLALIYGISGIRSAHLVQIVQVVLDSASVLLIVGIAANAYARRVGIAAGILAAISPLLALYGAMPLADAPTSWLVMGGVWALLRSAKQQDFRWAVAAGLLIGLSCWFRANGILLAFFLAAALFISLRAFWPRRLALVFGVLLGTLILVSPVVVRNSIAFNAFVPTGLGAGTNLWEGIGETSRAEEFGAVYGDRLLLERERLEMGRPDDETVGLYWPDGVRRDRERMRKSLAVISAHPFWYAGVMARRMAGHLTFVGSPSPIYGSTGFNISASKCLPPSLQFFPITAFVTGLGWIQAVLRFLILPLMLYGIVLGARSDWRVTILLLSPVFYYLFVGTFMHSEIRYSLPMQAVLFVFAGLGAVRLMCLLPYLSRFRGNADAE